MVSTLCYLWVLVFFFLIIVLYFGVCSSVVGKVLKRTVFRSDWPFVQPVQRSSPETQGVVSLQLMVLCLVIGFVCLFVWVFCNFLFFFLLMLFSVVFNYFFYIFCCFLSFFFCIFCFYHFFFREMVFSKVIDEIALFCRSFVLSQSSAKVSAGFTNVSGQAIAAFVHCILLPVHHPNCLCLWHS